MKKTEIVYRELIEFWNERLSQLELSKRLMISLSTVNNALKPLVTMGAVKILPRALKVVDREKILFHWASVRNLQKDIIYSARVAATPSGIEKNMPPNTVYTGYSAFKFKFHDVPADYGEVYVYCRDATEAARRFKPEKGPPNLFVLKPDERLIELAKDNIAPLSQVFVDLWNMREWYAKEFVNALKPKVLGGMA